MRKNLLQKEIILKPRTHATAYLHSIDAQARAQVYTIVQVYIWTMKPPHDTRTELGSVSHE